VNPQKPFQLYGILGFPVKHTLSPVMQEAAFTCRGIKAYYLALELDPIAFRKIMRKLPRLVLSGFNVTVPYKEKVIAYLDRLTPEARSVGAVNTVFRKGKKWVGANTDIDGFSASLKKEGGFNPKGKKVLVFGAGGAARGVVYGLCREGAQSIWIANRRLSRAQKIAKDMKRFFPKTGWQTSNLSESSVKAALDSVDLVINATSVGLSSNDVSLFQLDLIPPAKRRKILFLDLIYDPEETCLLKAARRKGHRTLGGAGMLLYQGVKAFKYWTGKKAPVLQMKQALLKALKERKRDYA